MKHYARHLDRSFSSSFPVAGRAALRFVAGLLILSLWLAYRCWETIRCLLCLFLLQWRPKLSFTGRSQSVRGWTRNKVLRMNMKEEFKIEVETHSLLITAYPTRNVVLFSSKFGAFSHSCTVDEFCDAADLAAASIRERPELFA